MTSGSTTSRGFFQYGCGALAGIASALLLAFALQHAGSSLVLFAYLASVPLFMAAFGLGIGPALFAAVFGAACLFAVTPASFGVFYAAADAVPAIILSFLALRRGRDGKFDNESSLAAAFAIYPCLLFLGVFAVTYHQDGGLLAMTNAAFDKMTDQVTEIVTQNGETVTPEMSLKIHHYLEIFARIVPSLTMGAWLFSTFIAMIVGQGILQRMGRSSRPPFVLAQLRTPLWLTIFLLLTTALAYMPAPCDYLGINIAVTLAIPFFFVGLAVIHAWTATKKQGTAILIVFYIILGIIPYLVPAVALLGVVDQGADFRKRFAGRSTTLPTA